MKIGACSVGGARKRERSISAPGSGAQVPRRRGARRRLSPRRRLSRRRPRRAPSQGACALAAVRRRLLDAMITVLASDCSAASATPDPIPENPPTTTIVLPCRVAMLELLKVYVTCSVSVLERSAAALFIYVDPDFRGEMLASRMEETGTRGYTLRKKHAKIEVIVVLSPAGCSGRWDAWCLESQVSKYGVCIIQIENE